jgi:hypothetical protein
VSELTGHVRTSGNYGTYLTREVEKELVLSKEAETELLTRGVETELPLQIHPVCCNAELVRLDVFAVRNSVNLPAGKRREIINVRNSVNLPALKKERK